MLDWPVIIVGATLFVAYANGANDNFKGVATLFGSGTTDYRKALGWATITTLAGSVDRFLSRASELISIFQGKGLVPSKLSESEPFVAAVVLGAALTVMLATKIGMPISTTHSLTGALFGGGLVAVGFDLGFQALAVNFFMPLLISPLCAVAIASFGFPLLSRALQRAGLNRENCLCVDGRDDVHGHSRRCGFRRDNARLARDRGARRRLQPNRRRGRFSASTARSCSTPVIF
jgi:inorganic phosphate transporter, PiT family